MVDEAREPAGADDLALRQQLDRASQEIERLTVDLDAAHAELAASGEAILARDEEMRLLRARIDESADEMREAAARYRDMALKAEPALPGEIIAGETVVDIDVSLDRARTIAEKVRARIESEARALRVPAGGTARTSRDIGSMSPAEKISFGLAQRQI